MANVFGRFVDYFFTQPVAVLKNKEKTQGESPLWRLIFVSLAALSLIGLLVLAKDAGISGDEFFHVHHSQDVFNYYKTGGEDKTAATPTLANNLPYYSQSPDTFIHLLIDAFGVEDYMVWRHAFCNILAWIGIVYACLLARKVGGWRAAALVCVLLFLSPRFLGHSFNNLKDIPFASACIMSIYYIVKFLEQLPKIRISTSVMLALSIAFATSIRVGGLLMVAYFGLFAIIYYIYKRQTLRPVFWKTLIWSLGICVVGYILCILTWPYALEGPVSNVYDAFANMSKFQIAIKQIFEGRMQWSDSLPWYYSPQYILMTTPIVVWLGFLLSVVFLKHNKRKWFLYLVLFFTALFPIIWIVADRSNVYGGWRHLLFAYPSIAILAGLGLNDLITLVRNRYAKWAVCIALCLLCIDPLAHYIRNHPYEYVYFNPLVGGTKAAYGVYETDYYYHSLREAADWIKENAKKDSLTTGDKIVVGCWHIHPTDYYFKDDKDRFSTAFIRWAERGNTDWDYAMVCVTGISPEIIQNGTFPPKNTVHQVKVDGTPVCIVLKREHKYDWQGFEAMQQKDVAKAEELYKKAAELDPVNETAVLGLAEIYLNRSKRDTNKAELLSAAENVLMPFLKANPSHENANLMKAHCLYERGQYAESQSLCDRIIQTNHNFEPAYMLAAQIRLTNRDLNGGEAYLTQLFNTGRISDALIKSLISIFKYQGLDEANAYLKMYSMLEDYYRKEGNNEEADKYAEAIEQLTNSMYRR